MPRGEFDRDARKAQTRARLLDAAARVYARRGFDGATLDEVAAEAGFTKGAVYSHFGSKENLLLALSQQQRDAQLTEQMVLFDRERSGSERPLAGAARWMEILREEPERFRLFVELWVRAQRDERLREQLAAGVEDLRELLAGFARAGAADAGIEADDAADRAGRERVRRDDDGCGHRRSARRGRGAAGAARRRALFVDPRAGDGPRGARAARRGRAGLTSRRPATSGRSSSGARRPTSAMLRGPSRRDAASGPVQCIVGTSASRAAGKRRHHPV